MDMGKYFSELFGTFVLVFFGCGTAVICGGITGGAATGFLGTLAIALAFGLSVTASSYAIGHISGCHLNPAVSLALLINKKLSVIDFISDVIAQTLGAIAGSVLLLFITHNTDSLYFSKNLGQNGFGANSQLGINMFGAIVIEVVLTFVFVMVILGVTSSKKFESVSGVIIGLTLTLVHLVGIPLTGTSVNPARSLAPAIFAGKEALSQVWVFLVAPLAGAALAALVFKYIFTPENKKVNEE